MIDLTTVANITGANPNVAALNETIPLAGDGTPLVKKWLDDIWGYQQAVLAHAGTTPSGANEIAGTSQILNGLISILSPVGSVIMWQGAVLPDTLGHRLLHLDGAGVLVSTYDALSTACWVGSSKNATAEAYYRADDSGGSSRSDTGTYLILPDMVSQSYRIIPGAAAASDTTFPQFDTVLAASGSAELVIGTYTVKFCVRY